VSGKVAEYKAILNLSSDQEQKIRKLLEEEYVYMDLITKSISNAEDHTLPDTEENIKSVLNIDQTQIFEAYLINKVNVEVEYSAFGTLAEYPYTLNAQEDIILQNLFKQNHPDTANEFHDRYNNLEDKQFSKTEQRMIWAAEDVLSIDQVEELIQSFNTPPDFRKIKIKEFTASGIPVKEALELLQTKLPQDTRFSISIEDEAVGKRDVNITLRGFDAKRILDFIAKLTDSRYELKDNTVYIYDSGIDGTAFNEADIQAKIKKANGEAENDAIRELAKYPVMLNLSEKQKDIIFQNLFKQNHPDTENKFKEKYKISEDKSFSKDAQWMIWAAEDTLNKEQVDVLIRYLSAREKIVLR